MGRVVIVQHGEKHKLPGDPGLTATGVEQARRTAAHLGTESRPSALLCSPLLRARQTAQPIAKALAVEVIIDERLVERINWDGSSTFEDFLVEWNRTTADRTYTPSYGESSQQAADRFLSALDEVAGEPDSHVICVAHGGVTMDLLRTIAGDAVVGDRWPDLLTGGVPPCALTRLSQADGGWHVDSVADLRHL